jgi:flagellar biosynthesis/type III secretory pathway protein FliH
MRIPGTKNDTGLFDARGVYSKFRPETWIERRMAVLWLRFLRKVDEQKFVVADDLMADAEISQTLKLCEEGAYTDSQLAAYDAYWDIIRVEKTLIAEGEARGRAEGEAKGRAEGLVEGEARGLAEGRAEGEKKSIINIILNCKRNGFSIEQMQTITGLGEDELREILRSTPI